MDTLTITQVHGSIDIGTTIDMPVRLYGWRRFEVWVKCPWRWPPKTRVERLVVTAVSRGTVEIRS